jgi:hypothetical protein
MNECEEEEEEEEEEQDGKPAFAYNLRSRICLLSSCVHFEVNAGKSTSACKVCTSPELPTLIESN